MRAYCNATRRDRCLCSASHRVRKQERVRVKSRTLLDLVETSTKTHLVCPRIFTLLPHDELHSPFHSTKHPTRCTKLGLITAALLLDQADTNP